MKKIFLGVIVVFFVMTLFGCVNSGNPDDPVIPDDQVNPSDQDNPVTDGFEFTNSTQQSAQEIAEKMVYYENEFITLSGMQGTETGSQSITTLSTEISPGVIQYTRDELPPVYIYGDTSDDIDPNFLFMLAFLIGEYADAILAAELFEEDNFFTIERSNNSAYIKVKNEGDQLYIEAYNYEWFKSDNYAQYSICANLIYLNTIDGHVYLEYVRDNYGNANGYETHELYYDYFYDTGDMINMFINMFDPQSIYYQNFDKSERQNFLLVNSEEGMSFAYTDKATNIHHTISFDGAGELRDFYLVYGYHDPIFRFFNENHQVRIIWNLLYVDGWDKIVTDQSRGGYLYSGDTEVLQGFYHDFFIDEYTSIFSELSIPEENVTQSVVDLSDYGLSFDDITLAQAIQDSTYLVDHYPDILTLYGYSADMAANHNLMISKVPFVMNEEVFNYLQTLLEAELVN